MLEDLALIKQQSLSSSKLLTMLSGNLAEIKKTLKQPYRSILIIDTVKHALKLCAWPASDLKNSVTIIESPNFSLHAPEIMIIHVLINLFRNAFREIEKQGDGKIIIACRQDKKYNILIFQDTVGSLQKKDTSVIFYRGFSTYETGLGFGLAFCSEVMRSLGGDIACEVNAQGTFFRLYFPKGDKL